MTIPEIPVSIVFPSINGYSFSKCRLSSIVSQQLLWPLFLLLDFLILLSLPFVVFLTNFHINHRHEWIINRHKNFRHTRNIDITNQPRNTIHRGAFVRAFPLFDVLFLIFLILVLFVMSSMFFHSKHDQAFLINHKNFTCVFTKKQHSKTSFKISIFQQNHHILSEKSVQSCQATTTYQPTTHRHFLSLPPLKRSKSRKYPFSWFLGEK